MRRSLRNRLALVFFVITLVAIAALYLYVAPGLRTRLIDERMSELATTARGDSGQIVKTVGSATPESIVRGKVDAAALASGDITELQKWYNTLFQGSMSNWSNFQNGLGIDQAVQKVTATILEDAGKRLPQV